MALANGFVCASVMPWKLLRCPAALDGDRIVPYHLQFSPTHKCNGGCPWCCCRKLDRTDEMPFDEAKECLSYFRALGCRAVTFTGGGEPTLHPHYTELVLHAQVLGCSVATITNGVKIAQTEGIHPTNNALTWLRLSIIDTVSGKYPIDRIRKVCNVLPNVDIGLTFAVPKNASIETAVACAKIVNEIPNLTHIRYTEDIVDYAPEQMAQVEAACRQVTDKAIYQYRHNGIQGPEKCWVSRLKPLVDARGLVFPCCGIQYAQEGQDTMTFDLKHSMGHWRNYHLTKPFDGRVCTKCFYNDYNTVLDGLVKPLAHPDFL